MVLHRPLDHRELYTQLGAAIAFATGTDEAIRKFMERTGADPIRDAEMLVLAEVAGKDGRNDTVAIVQGLGGQIPVSPVSDGDFRIERPTPSDLVFGDHSAVQRAIALFSGATDASVLQNGEIMGALGSLRRDLPIRGAAAPEWLRFGWKESDFAAADIDGVCVCRSLSEIRAMEFSASIADDKVDFAMKTELKGTAGIGVLVDALRGSLASLQLEAKRSAPAEVQQFVNAARVRADGASIVWEMAPGGAALQRIRTNEWSKALLQWNLGDAHRETFQNTREIMDLLGLSKGGRVADVGSGLGFFTVRLARAVGSEGRVFAVDIDRDTVEKLRWRTQQGPYPQVDVILGRPDDPKLPRETLDAVLIVNSYHEMPQHQEMLRQIRSALKPGGRLLITEPRPESQRVESRESQEKKHVLEPELAEQDLLQEGFEVLVRNDEFIQYPDGGRRDWLILARRPWTAVKSRP
jgi:ubiquinone/menaquinone biosynthesis C-methylase UbiE